jgi:CPA1 family monovalent cation:H+ antiporter
MNARDMIALRYAYSHQQAMLQNQKINSDDEQQVFLNALQEELNYIEQQRTQGDADAELLKELYDEVINSQAILLANISSE